MKWLPWVLGVVVVGVVFGAVTLSSPSGRANGPRLDPRSTVHDGARAAVLLLEESGVEVRSGDVPARGEVGTIVVLVDDLDDDAWDGVTRFVERGGDLVVADPFAPLAARVRTTLRGEVSLIDGCDVPELARVTELDVPVLRTFAGAGQHCLGTESGPAVHVARVGDGRVLSLGTAHPWRNDSLAEEHHAALVVGVGQWATPPVRLLFRGPAGTGDQTLWELVPDWVWASLAQVVVAVALYALWRAVRLGPPLSEDDPVETDSDALVRALATLTERSANDAAVVGLLAERWRDELRARTGARGREDHEMVERLGLSGDAAAVVARSLAVVDGDAMTGAALIHEARLLVDRVSRESGSNMGSPPTQEVDA